MAPISAAIIEVLASSCPVLQAASSARSAARASAASASCTRPVCPLFDPFPECMAVEPSTLTVYGACMAVAQSTLVRSGPSLNGRALEPLRSELRAARQARRPLSGWASPSRQLAPERGVLGCPAAVDAAGRLTHLRSSFLASRLARPCAFKSSRSIFLASRLARFWALN